MKGFVTIGVIIGLVFLGSLGGGGNSGGASYTSGYYDDSYEYEEEPEEDVVTSDNWDCTSDCSGHEAGYEWASDNGITDPYDCDGNSDSFIEGCEAYANEYSIENEEQAEENEYYNDYYEY